VDQAFLDALTSIVGPAGVSTDAAIRDAAGRDALLRGHAPEAVVTPGTTAEIAAIARLCHDRRVPMTVRGGGTGYTGGSVPIRGGLVIAMSRFDRILAIDEANLFAVVQPNVVTGDLHAAVEARGLFYPPDPASLARCAIGGNVAEDAGGPRGFKYGTTRKYVLALEAVLPTGEVIRTGGRLWKDVAGYDLTRLLTGSEGTLAVITEVTVALLPMPAVARTGVAYFDSLSDAGRAVAGVIRDGLVPATLEFLDNRCVNAVEDFAHLGLDRQAGALLLFGDDGTPEAVERSLGIMAATCERVGARGVTMARDVAESEALLTARRCSLPALARLAPITLLEDATVPRPKIAEMVDRIEAISARHQVVCATFGHAGDGNLHPTIVFDPADGDVRHRAEAAFGEIFAAAMDLGGTITGEHGVGAAKRGYLQARLGADQMALLRRLKAAFDPAGILNPGKLGS
jgi:glycolate oxidase